MKRKLKKEFTGESVMIHPQLTTDPLKRQGQIGKVTAVSWKERNIVSVQFPDGKSANYMSDGILILFPKSKIIKNIGANPDLTNGEKWALLKIARDLTWGEKAEAFEKALTNTKVLSLSTINFARWMET